MGWAGDAVAFDYDGDGHMDVLVTSMFGRSQLYRTTATAPLPTSLEGPWPHAWGGLALGSSIQQ